MTHDRILSALERIDSELDVQSGRVSLMSRWLDEHGARLDALEARFEATRARLDALLGAARRTA
ncbi:MAG: hypothetical protein KC503_38740 [Myxococcales bacterium]|nr:hypothetical protein [Myxococcales bacterium]